MMCTPPLATPRVDRSGHAELEGGLDDLDAGGVELQVEEAAAAEDADRQQESDAVALETLKSSVGRPSRKGSDRPAPRLTSFSANTPTATGGSANEKPARIPAGVISRLGPCRTGRAG